VNQYKPMKLERVSLRKHAVLNEKWVQEQIAANPSILGLGDLALKDKERIQPRAGRLDLLLQDTEDNRRYEVEVQLGETDESHIIRTIEYWDIERKRYPQYDHCAVIVAEHITARFLNVISLFNGTIPLVAIQMSALARGDEVALVFTTVLDELTRGLVDEDEEVQPTTNRAYWEDRASVTSVAAAEKLLSLIRQFTPQAELSFKKQYVGLTVSGQANNFVSMEPKKAHLILRARIPQSDEMTDQLKNAGLDLLPYDKAYGTYRVRLSDADIAAHQQDLVLLFKAASEANT
jgi:hypothetical protein